MAPLPARMAVRRPFILDGLQAFCIVGVVLGNNDVELLPAMF